ncbi:MAG: alpha/beta fold hydrolase, partial [Rhodanobacteraceae bacterium]
MLRFVLAMALAALLPFSLARAAEGAPATDPYAAGREVIAEIGDIVTPDGVDENLVVTLGGIPQAINVRGASRKNPILLFLHGGPGAVEMPIAWSFQRPWEDFFTVVQWDQRAAGKTYALSDPARIEPTLTPDRYRDDAIELIEYLGKRYGQDKIVLMGHSWGSALGLLVARKRPDLLIAYVGVGQIVDWRQNEKLGFEWTLARARATNNRAAIEDLEAMQPYPPEKKPMVIDDADRWRKWAIGYGSLAAGRTNADFYFHAARLSPEYTREDLAAWDKGSTFTVTTLWPRLSDLSFVDLKKLDVPVVLMLGRQDHTIAPEPAAEWLQKLDAPKKTVIWFEHSAHLPMLEEPGLFFAALVEQVVPLAKLSRHAAFRAPSDTSKSFAARNRSAVPSSGILSLSLS